jgi:putative FmdB family regulatory protein
MRRSRFEARGLKFGVLKEPSVPIYDYRCQACGHQFEAIVLKPRAVTCPACASENLERLLSVPAVKSESTHAQAMKAAKARDTRQASEKNRAQREYELKHND